MMSTTLSLMERVLQFTAQETGTTASHYQSAKEVGLTATNSNQRRNLTASGVDDGFEAWGRQIVTGAKAYLNNDIVAQVSSDIKDYAKHVAALGFEVRSVGDRKILVAGPKSKLPLETFARSNIGPETNKDPQVAQAMMSALSVVFQNETVFAAVGAKRVVKLLEQVVKLAGGPRDFDISSEVNDQQNVPDAQMMEKLKPIFEQLQQAILNQVQENLAKPMAEAQAKDQQRLDALEQIAKALQSEWKAAGIEAAKLQIQQGESQQGMAIEKARFEAEQQRLTQQHQLDMQIAAAKAGLDAQVATEKAQSATEKERSDAALAGYKSRSDAAIAASRAAVETTTKLEKHEADLQLQEEAAAVDRKTKMELNEAKVKATEKAATAQAAATKKAASKEKPPS